MQQLPWRQEFKMKPLVLQVSRILTKRLKRLSAKREASNRSPVDSSPKTVKLLLAASVRSCRWSCNWENMTNSVSSFQPAKMARSHRRAPSLEAKLNGLPSWLSIRTSRRLTRRCSHRITLTKPRFKSSFTHLRKKLMT